MFGLKDVFFTTLVVLMTVAFLTLLVGAAWTHTTRSTNLLAAAVGIAAMGLIAGTRAYFSILLWAAIAVTYAGCFMTGVPARRRAAAQAAIALPMLALAIAFCAEGNYPRFVWSLIVRVPEAVVEHQTPIPIDGVQEFDRRRKAIEEYGGNSMLIRPREKAGSASLHKEKAGSPSLPTETTGSASLPAETTGSASPPAETEGTGRLEGIAIGLGAVLLPSAVIGRLAGIDLHVSTAARLIADADTLVFDVLAALILWVVIVNRRETSSPPLVFGLVLALLVALPLAYVMTNFGTLVRLRLLVAAPIWLLTLALAPGLAGSRAPSQAPGPGPAPTR